MTFVYKRHSAYSVTEGSDLVGVGAHGLSRRAILRGGLAMAAGVMAPASMDARARQGHGPGLVHPGGEGPERITSLLSLIPREFRRQGPYWEYDDYARQFASLGIDHDSGGPDAPESLVDDAIGSMALQYLAPIMSAGREDFVRAMGFNPLGMHQMLITARSAMERVTLYRGDIDPDALVAAWTGFGYEPRESASGIPLWTINPEGENVLDMSATWLWSGQLYNVAIIDDVVAFTSTLSMLEDVLDLVTNGGETILDDPLCGALAGSLPDTTVSSIVLPAAAMQDPRETSGEEFVEDAAGHLARVRDEVGPMPELQGMAFAVNEGTIAPDADLPTDNPREDAGLGMIRMAASSPEDAAQANLVVTRRFEELDSPIFEVPYSQVFRPLPGEVSGNIASLDFRLLDRPYGWATLVKRSDILPFVVDGA